jgi:hypothetical protein
MISSACPTATNTGDSSTLWAGVQDFVKPEKPYPAPQTLREAKAAGNTSDVDVEQ